MNWIQMNYMGDYLVYPKMINKNRSKGPEQIWHICVGDILKVV